jgi:hypothetical protein
MYFTKTQLQKKQEVSLAEATKIWNDNYYNGWKHWLTLGALALTLVSIYLFSLPSWSWLNLLVLVHMLIAMPIASNDMKAAVRKLKKRH